MSGIRIRTEDRPISFTMNGASPAERLEPITLVWAKAHLRYTSSAEDVLITSYLAAAREYFEDQTRRQCVDATWEYALDQVPDERVLEIPRPPLASVVSVTYEDAAGLTQTFDAANYVVRPSFVVPEDDTDPAIDPHCPCGSIELIASASWPATSGRRRSLRIRRVCGYGATAAAMPGQLQAALGGLVQQLHARGSLAADATLQSFKYSALPVAPPTTLLRDSVTGPPSWNWWAR